MENTEIWKDIEGYEGLYQVSNFGRVKSLERVVIYSEKRKAIRKERILQQCLDKKGYSNIELYKNNIRKTVRVHKLVALAFIPNNNPTEKTEINHLDENKENNHVSNLEWCTHLHNMNYGTRNTRISDKHKGKKRSKEFVKKMQKPILQYTLDGEFLKEWESIKQASEELNISSCYICNYLKGRRKTCGGYIWKYK